MVENSGLTLADAAKMYLAWRQSRGYAEGTMARDRATLTRLVESAGKIKVASLSTHHIDDFFHERTSLSPGTQNTDLAALRSFCRYLESRGYHKRATQLLADYRAVRHAPKPRRRLAVGEFPALLDCAEKPRDRMLLSVGLYLFLRASEIKLLRIKHVNLATDEISVVIPKTKDADVMPVSAELGKELRSWLTYYSTECGPLDPEWFLVPHLNPVEWERAPTGALVKPTAFQPTPTRAVNLPERVVQRALKKFGWTDTHQEGVHTLRRSGARALYDELAESDGHSNALETVSAMLHHKVMATTQIYLGLTESRRKRDRLIRGKPMFPSLSDQTITPFGVTRQDGTHG